MTTSWRRDDGYEISTGRRRVDPGGRYPRLDKGVG